MKNADSEIYSESDRDKYDGNRETGIGTERCEEDDDHMLVILKMVEI